MVINKLHICKEWHIQPSEIDKLTFFEFEYMLEEINKVHTEQEKRQQEEEKRHESMQNSFKMPKMPNISMPSFNMPKL